MELNFKDKKTTKLFKDIEKLDLKQEKFETNDFAYEDVIPLSNNKITKKESSNSNDKIITKPVEILITSTNNQLKRIESKQNAILEILQCVELPTVKQINLQNINHSDMDILKLNLRLFNEKLIILSTNSNDSIINKILTQLNDISEHLLSNSFNIFNKSNSPIPNTLKDLEFIGIGDGELNSLIQSTIITLNKIDKYSKENIFEQSYYYSKLLLEKGLILNAVTLFNESAGMYITQSAKSQSKVISKYIHLVAEQQCSKLYSQAKDFFIGIFLDKKEISATTIIFPHHKISKDIDKEIARKFQKIQITWKNKGDGGVFEKYAYIIKRLRIIRNSLAHGNLEVNFRSLTQEIQELNDDFYYLAIEKNILKK